MSLGPSDDTLSVLDRFRDCLDVRVVEGPHRGVPGCFFALVEAAASDSDVVAFADQDDVWFPDKVRRAVAGLDDAVGCVTPTLYCSKVVVADAHLRPKGEAPYAPRGPSFRNALAQNIAIGCTIAMNRAGLELLRRLTSSDVIMHDWWCYLAFTGLGEVRWDPKPSLYYRQHGTNAVGAGGSSLERLYRRVRRQLDCSGRRRRVRQLEAFLDAAGRDLPRQHRDFLLLVLTHRAGVANRLLFALRAPRMMQSLGDDFVFRIVYILGNY